VTKLNNFLAYTPGELIHCSNICPTKKTATWEPNQNAESKTQLTKSYSHFKKTHIMNKPTKIKNYTAVFNHERTANYAKLP
jgi:hypothetical protein